MPGGSWSTGWVSSSSPDIPGAHEIVAEPLTSREGKAEKTFSSCRVAAVREGSVNENLADDILRWREDGSKEQSDHSKDKTLPKSKC